MYMHKYQYMSLHFRSGLIIKTYHEELSTAVYLNGEPVPIEDFLAAAMYVLTNTSLSTTDDPRLEFVDVVKSMQVQTDTGLLGISGQYLRPS